MLSSVDLQEPRIMPHIRSLERDPNPRPSAYEALALPD